MSLYSNVTEAEMERIMAAKKQKKVLSDIRYIVPDKCKYAEDTGELAFFRAPCRGNKIICRKIEGHISFVKACSAGQCKHFELLIDNNGQI